jgi:hypothetical protein
MGKAFVMKMRELRVSILQSLSLKVAAFGSVALLPLDELSVISGSSPSAGRLFAPAHVSHLGHLPGDMLIVAAAVENRNSRKISQSRVPAVTFPQPPPPDTVEIQLTERAKRGSRRHGRSSMRPARAASSYLINSAFFSP